MQHYKIYKYLWLASLGDHWTPEGLHSPDSLSHLFVYNSLTIHASGNPFLTHSACTPKNKKLYHRTMIHLLWKLQGCCREPLSPKISGFLHSRPIGGSTSTLFAGSPPHGFPRRRREKFYCVKTVFFRIFPTHGFPPPLVVERSKTRGEPKNPQNPKVWMICFRNLAKKHLKISGRIRRPERSKTRGENPGGGSKEYHWYLVKRVFWTFQHNMNKNMIISF